MISTIKRNAAERRAQAGRTPRGRRAAGVSPLLLPVLAGVLALTPAAMSGAVLNEYAVPKFVVLLLGASAVLGLLARDAVLGRSPRALRSRFALGLGVYVALLAVSTALGVAPAISLLGSFGALMGFATHACFAVCAAGVLAATDGRRRAAVVVLKAIVGGGLLVAGSCVAQLAGAFPTDAAAASTLGGVFRVYGTIGHPDYAGNFLLYVLFTGLGCAVLFDGRAWRWGALAASALSAVAILYTGTRGAWVGAVAGALVGALALWRYGRTPAIPRRAATAGAAAAGVLLAAAAAAVLFTPAGAPVRSRFAAFAAEGFTGAGRTVIWKQSLAMLPRYALTGCGLEAYRLAMLPFKTQAYEQAMSGMTAEDPHDAYLSALLSTGVFATAAYLALVAAALGYLVRAARAARERRDAVVAVGLLASLAAALTHDVFLHHMIPTGLYLFAFLAVSFAWHRLVAAPATEPLAAEPRRLGRAGEVLLAVACAVPLAAASVFAWRLASADASMLRCMAAARAGDDVAARLYGERAANAGLYQTDYHFLYGAALERLAASGPEATADARLEMAAAHMEIATRRTLTPVTNLVSLALLDVRLGRFDDARAAIEEAERLDPATHLTHLAWSSYYLRTGDLDAAVAHYQRAGDLGALSARLDPLGKSLKEAIRSSDHRRRLRRALLGPPPD